MILASYGKDKMLRYLFAVGRPFSCIYSLLMKIRAFLYQKNIFKTTILPVPVVSVGNLTMGGTGKTPMVEYLAKLLSQTGKIAIVSRGYRGKAKEEVNIVSDGRLVLLSAEIAGDEPRLLAESLPGVAVLTGTKRVCSGRYAIERFKAGIIIVDDGFQHMSLGRTLNLVLFSALDFLGNERVCPGGPLREPISALKRADCFVITGIRPNRHSLIEDFKARLGQMFPEIPFFEGNYQFNGLSCPQDNESLQPSSLEAGALFAFCGIAVPASFQDSLTKENILVKGFRSFRDHHIFSTGDLRELEQAARKAGCCGLVTTAKDYIKFGNYHFNLPMYIFKVRLNMGEDFDRFVLGKIGQGDTVGKS